MSGTTSFRLSRWVYPAAVFLSVFPLVGLSGALAGSSPGERIFGGVLFLVSAVWVARFARSGVVIAEPDRLVVRQVFRTDRIPFSRIQNVTTAERRWGAMAYRRSFIVVEFTDGSRKFYGDLSSGPSNPGRPARAVGIAAELNRIISAWRHDPHATL